MLQIVQEILHIQVYHLVLLVVLQMQHWYHILIIYYIIMVLLEDHQVRSLLEVATHQLRQVFQEEYQQKVVQQPMLTYHHIIL